MDELGQATARQDADASSASDARARRLVAILQRLSPQLQQELVGLTEALSDADDGSEKPSVPEA